MVIRLNQDGLFDHPFILNILIQTVLTMFNA